MKILKIISRPVCKEGETVGVVSVKDQGLWFNENHFKLIYIKKNTN